MECGDCWRCCKTVGKSCRRTHLISMLQGLKVYHVALVYCGLAAFMLMLSLFIPRWRVDDIGATQFNVHWTIDGFKMDSRSYGILYVKGEHLQSWQSVAQFACDFQSMGYVAGWVSATANSANGDCENDKCSGGWFTHMAERCRVYRSVRTLSNATMGLTFCAIMATVVGLMLCGMISTKRIAGVSFGLFFVSGLVCLLMCVWWAYETDVGFKELGQTAYFPYPSLGLGFFLHLYGSVTLIVASSVYLWVLYPVVVGFDEAQHKMNKKIEKMEKRKEMKEKAEQRQLKQMQQQQQPMQMPMQMQQGYVPPHLIGQMAPQMQMGPANGAHMQVGQVGAQMQAPAPQAGQPLKANF